MITEDQKRRALKKISDAGEAIAFKAPGIAAVWLGKLRGKIELTDKVKTAEVSDGKLWVNPSYLDGLHPAEALFVIAHEVLHVALGHTGMAESMGLLNPDSTVNSEKKREWNKLGEAKDMLINTLLEEDNVGRAPAGALKLPGDYEGPRETLALYYWLLEQEDPPGDGEGDGDEGDGEGDGGAGGQGQGDGDEGDGEGDGQQGPQGDQPSPGSGCQPRAPQGASQADNQQEATEARTTLQQLGIGKGTSIAEALKPVPSRTGWREVIGAGLAAASTEASNRTTKTYARASRREPIDPGIVLAGYTGSDPSICVLFDVSGSVSRTLVEKSAGHLLKMASEFPLMRIFFATHTDEVCWSGWIKAGGDVNAITEATSYSGGTDARPAYEAAQQAAPKGGFDCLVHFTDCDLPGDWPESPSKRLIVGALGRASLGELYCKPPAGARVIPVQES